MSIRRVTNGRSVGRQQPLASNANLGVSASGSASQWTRPAEWLPLADVTGSQQRFSGLFAIYPDGNFLALSAAGAYTVDWGDGTVENFASGAVAYRNYTYANISNANESTLGYRQVVVQVYPQSGQNLTTLNLQQRHNQTGLNTAYVTPWLDIAVNGASLTSLSIGGATTPLRMLRQATIYSHALTSAANLFQNCASLQSVPLFNTAAVQNMQNLFNGCTSLQSVPLFNTASATNMNSMFVSCASLQSVPLFNTASATNMSSMFNGCSSLQSVPLFNTAAATNMSSMFNGCSSLQSVPLFNTAAATNMGVMFQSCASLQSVPLFNTAAVTNMPNMFQNCTSLQSVPLFNTAAAQNMQNLFQGCTSLQSVPALNTTAVTAGNFSGVFGSCPSLVRCGMTGINQTISFASCKLSAAEINAIFNNLSNTGAGKTITVTGNYGAATCNTALATAKGWTVAT